MPCLFHANLFALGGARWRCQNIGVALIKTCQKGTGLFWSVLSGQTWSSIAMKSFKNVPNDYIEREWIISRFESAFKLKVGDYPLSFRLLLSMPTFAGRARGGGRRRRARGGR